MTYNEQTRILKAADGKYITDGKAYGIEAKLAPSDNVSNWWEVDTLPPESNQSQDAENVEPLNL